MPESSENYCKRCGKLRPGTRKLMFCRSLERFPQPPIAREFFCFRCEKVMRIYAIVGLTLLALIVAALVIATILLTR